MHILEDEALFHLLRFTVGQNSIPGHTSKNCYPLTTPKSTMHNSQACIHIHFTTLMAPLIRVLATDLTQLELQGSDPPWCTATAAWVDETGMNRVACGRLSNIPIHLWKRNECVNFKIRRKHAKSWECQLESLLSFITHSFSINGKSFIPFSTLKHHKCPVSALNIGLGSGMLVEDEVVFSGWIGVPLRMRILGSARRFMVSIFLSIWFPQP